MKTKTNSLIRMRIWKTNSHSSWPFLTSPTTLLLSNLLPPPIGNSIRLIRSWPVSKKASKRTSTYCTEKPHSLSPQLLKVAKGKENMSIKVNQSKAATTLQIKKRFRLEILTHNLFLIPSRIDSASWGRWVSSNSSSRRLTNCKN